MTSTEKHNEKIIDQHTLQAGEYARMTQTLSSGRPMSFIEALGVRRDDRLLDIACGPGSLTIDLAPYVASATGLDLTPAMLDQARQAQERLGLTVEWVQGDAAALPFANAAFTLVTSSAAFHHFAEPRKVLSEMIRVCAPGGRIVVMDVTPQAGKEAAYDRLERMRDPSHGHAHSIAELQGMGCELGLDDPQVSSNPTGPLSFEAVLATSFPEQHTREELLQLMREDAETGLDQLGFMAELVEGRVLVTYPMSTLIWTRR